MSLERRDGGVYHYTHRRVGRRVVKEYDGSGQLALLGAELLDADKEMRRQKAIDRKVRRDVRAAREAAYRDWLAGVAAAVADALRAAGWHQHNREWRRKRGATMSGLATFGAGGAPTWHGDRLKAVAGELPDDIEAKAQAGDESARPAVDEFLKTPEAVALWGDVGRRVLVKWVDRYAGSHLTTERAVYRFAADLRDRLAGPNPSALEVLLAERVVIGWVFLNHCESNYLNALEKLSWDVSKCHTQRIELAHRNLMAACGTLAKVRRAKLPDLLALVNLTPPVPPGG